MVAEGAGEERGLGQPGKCFGCVDDKRVGYGAREQPALLLGQLELVKDKRESVSPHSPDGEIAKYEKTALAVIGVLEAVERRYQRACEVALFRPRLLVLVFIALADQSGRQDEVWVLEKCPARVLSGVDHELYDGWRVDRFPLCVWC